MTRPVRTALIGYGFAGRTLHAPLIQATPGLELTLIVTSRPKRARADFPNTRAVDSVTKPMKNPDIDLVVLATPNGTHFPLGREAMVRGKHLVIDKPLATNWKEAVALHKTATETGRILSVFHNRRFDSDFLTVSRVLAEGRIGRPVLYEERFDRYRPQTSDRWRERAEPGAGVWFDLGPHLVDHALQLFGWPQTLWADIAATRDGALADDDFLVVLGYPRLRAVLRAGTLAAVEGPRITLLGDAGGFQSFGFDPQAQALIEGRRPGGPDWGVHPRPPELRLGAAPAALAPVASQAGDYRRYYAALAQAIRGDGPNPVPPGEALQVQAILEIARDSATTGRRIVLEKDRRTAGLTALGALPTPDNVISAP